MSHFIEASQEVICVYCAFLRLKRTPGLEIKELEEKSSEVNIELAKITEEIANYINYIQDHDQESKKLKESEQQNLLTFFDEISKALEEKKQEVLNSLNEINDSNIHKSTELLAYLKNRQDEANKIKEAFDNKQTHFSEMLEAYSNFSKEYFSSSHRLTLEHVDFKFLHEDPAKVKRFLSSIYEFKSKQQQSNLYRLSLNNWRKGDANEEPEYEDKKAKKPKKEFIVENAASLEGGFKKRATDGDDHGLSRLKKELLFNNNNLTSNNRIINPNANTFTFEAKSKSLNKEGENKLTKSTNVKENRNFIGKDN